MEERVWEIIEVNGAIGVSNSNGKIPLKGAPWMTDEEREACTFIQNGLLLQRHTLSFLKLMAATGKLYFKKKPLICNFFSPITFHFEGETLVAKVKERSFLVKEADLVVGAPQPILIYRQCLYISDQLIPLKILNGARPNDEEWDYLIDEGVSMPPKKEKELLHPKLTLKDRIGSFATLNDPSWEKDLLEAGYQKRVDNEYYCPSVKVVETLTFLVELGWEVIDSSKRCVVPYTSSCLNADVHQGAIQLTGHVNFKEESVPIEKLFKERLDHFTPLSLTKVGLLPPNGLDLTPFELVGDSVKGKRGEIAPILTNKKESISFGETLSNLLSSKGDVAHPSDQFKGTLRPYQQEGLSWLYRLYQAGLSGLLADDMGLGKTVQILSFLSKLSKDRPSLIVAPTSLLFHWEREFKRFLPSWNVNLYHGKERRLDGADAIITSYQTLRIDLESFLNRTFAALVIDEAQAIKNENTQVAKALSQIDSQFRVSLTGTPIENHLGELKSQFEFLLPGLISESDLLKPATLKRKIAPFFMRRHKGDVAKELPPLIEQTHFLEMDEIQKGHYQRLLILGKAKLIEKVSIDGQSRKRMEIFELILRLRQICCHPQLVQQEGPSIKEERLLSDLDELISSGKRVIVFSQFTSFLKLIRNRLPYPSLYLDGETKERAALVDTFQRGEANLFFISLKAGGAGLNLQNADVIILLDPWWNRAAEEQAISRSHRLGREESVLVLRYIVKDSIEERVQNLQEAKKSLSNTLLNEVDHSSFSEEEFNLLFG